jgi:hypothetical protein
MKAIRLFIIIIFFACNKNNPAAAPTSLRIIVTDSNGNLLPGAEVKLFGSLYDLRTGANQIGRTHMTDQNGSALFDSLQPAKYAFYVEKACMNNQTPDLGFQIPGFPVTILDTTKAALTASVENRSTTSILGTGSLKYINNSATDTFSYTWTIAGNFVVPTLTFLDVVGPGDSLALNYQPAGVYKTRITQIGGPFKTMRVDTLYCGDSLTIHLP